MEADEFLFQTESKFNKQKYEKNTTAFLRKEWFSGIRTADELYEYHGAKLPPAVIMNDAFKKVFTYVYYLYNQISDYKGGSLSDGIQDEIFHFEREGKMCVHLSVITYFLMLHYKIADERSMRYVQGYYWHLASKRDWISSMFGSEHAGTHAWIVVGKAVIDLSIKQEELFFSFDGLPLILGEVPDGLLLKGFSEPKKTVNKHAEAISAFRKLNIKEWINSHLDGAERIYIERQIHHKLKHE